MKFGLWTQYGALNSKPVFEALEKGLTNLGHTVVFNTDDCDIPVIWSVLWNGRMAPNKKVWDDFHAHNKKIIVLEVGGLIRGTTWKVGVGGINREAYFGPKGNDNTRAKKLGIKDEKKKYNIDDIIKGDVIFCATGVTSGDLTDGVKTVGNKFEVSTFALHKSKKTDLKRYGQTKIELKDFQLKNIIKLSTNDIRCGYIKSLLDLIKIKRIHYACLKAIDSILISPISS